MHFGCLTPVDAQAPPFTVHLRLHPLLGRLAELQDQRAILQTSQLALNGLPPFEGAIGTGSKVRLVQVNLAMGHEVASREDLAKPTANRNRIKLEHCSTVVTSIATKHTKQKQKKNTEKICSWLTPAGKTTQEVSSTASSKRSWALALRAMAPAEGSNAIPLAAARPVFSQNKPFDSLKLISKTSRNSELSQTFKTSKPFHFNFQKQKHVFSAQQISVFFRPSQSLMSVMPS